MNSIIMRSALIAWGHNPPPYVASVVTDHDGRHVVTWDDVMRQRRERQAEIMARKRSVEQWRAVRLYVAWYGHGIMGGWQAMIDGIDPHDHAWIDRDRKHYRSRLMELFTQDLPLLDMPYGAWEEWKPLFAKSFERRRQLNRPVGVVYLWKRHDELALRPA